MIYSGLQLYRIRGGVPLIGHEVGHNFRQIKNTINKLENWNFHPATRINPSRFSSRPITMKQVANEVRASTFADFNRIPRLSEDGGLTPTTVFSSLPTGDLWIHKYTAGTRLCFGHSGASKWATVSMNGWFDGDDPTPGTDIYLAPEIDWDPDNTCLVIQAQNYTTDGTTITAGKVFGYINLCGTTVATIFCTAKPDNDATLEDAYMEFDETNHRILFGLGSTVKAYINSSGRQAGAP